MNCRFDQHAAGIIGEKRKGNTLDDADQRQLDIYHQPVQLCLGGGRLFFISGDLIGHFSSVRSGHIIQLDFPGLLHPTHACTDFVKSRSTRIPQVKDSSRLIEGRKRRKQRNSRNDFIGMSRSLVRQTPFQLRRIRQNPSDIVRKQRKSSGRSGSGTANRTLARCPCGIRSAKRSCPDRSEPLLKPRAWQHRLSKVRQ